MDKINLQDISSFIFLAFMVESIWETIKMGLQDNKLSIDKIGVMAISCIFCIFFNKDMFSALGMTDGVTIIGLLGTGILVSRGSNFMHDFLKKIREIGGII